VRRRLLRRVAFREREYEDLVPQGVSAVGSHFRSVKSRVLVGVAAVALLASVMVGLVANLSTEASTLTMASVSWCRNCS
jgi:hypothetical protein